MKPERYSEAETMRVAQRLLALLSPDPKRATVVGLSGDLGAGKTTLAKAIADQLGIQETVQSPTFVVAKFYQPTKGDFSQLVHIDAYRIEDEKELDPLHLGEVFERPHTLVIIEWPERIKRALSEHAQYFLIEHDGDHRIIRKHA